VAAAQQQDSRHPALEVLILGGQPIREPMAQYGPFVMNTREQLAEAVADYQAGRLGVIPDGALMPHTGR
jgi:redox-sensitive bicupin YhaK (pirin superfamily)